MESRGLGRFVGENPEIAVAAITDELAPTGATREEAAARAAINEAFTEFYNDAALASTDAAAGLVNITAVAMTKAMTTAVASYIYRRWVGDLGIKIEQNAISRQSAVRLEKQVKKFVRDAVKFDVQGRDVLKMNWSKEGKALIDKIYTDAYAMLGGEA
jgi:hypothetical protein